MTGGPACGGSVGRSAAEAVRVAAIDCGTNSLRLLIADIDRREATLTDQVRRMEIVRLGQGVDATGRLAPDALARTFGVLEEYARIISDTSASAVRMVATSATRDAANSAAFVGGVTRILGVPPEVLSGAEEAVLSYTGATAELARPGPGSDQLAADWLAPPYLVVDIGGGSTEFVLGGEQPGGARPGSPRQGAARVGGSGAAGGSAVPGDARAAGSVTAAGLAAGSVTAAGLAAGSVTAAGLAAGSVTAAGLAAGSVTAAGLAAGSVTAVGLAVGQPPAGSALAAVSVDIGCVRMTERHLHCDPPAEPEIAAATADIDAAIDAAAARVPVERAHTLIGLAGSVTTVAGIALGLPGYDASRIHHARVPANTVHAVARMLLGQTRAQRGLIGVMHPGRVDVIGAGALVLDRILARLGFAEVVASEHDILDGIAWSLVDGHAG